MFKYKDNAPFLEHSEIVAHKDHNIWHYSHPRNISLWLWHQPAFMRDDAWALECTKTFSTLPQMPRIISASEMAKVWGVSHVTAKKLLRGDWEWIPISARHFVHTSQITHPLHYRILRAKNPIEICKLLTRLSEFPLNVPAYHAEIVNYLGRNKNVYGFSGLLKLGILKQTRTLFGRRKVYYVSSHTIH